MPDSIRFRLNGRPVSLQTDGTRKLLRVLRNDLELTGTKYGCGEGLCGSCTVLVDGRALRACRGGAAGPRSWQRVSANRPLRQRLAHVHPSLRVVHSPEHRKLARQDSNRGHP